MVTELESLSEQLNAASIFVDENIKNGKGKNIAIYYNDETLTYQDVSEMVNKTGNALRNIGVNMEERVMLILHDSPEFIASFFGAIKIGAVPIPTNTMLKANDFQYFDDLVMNESSDLDAAQTHRDDAAFWLYSSGSTGWDLPEVELTLNLFQGQ